MQLHFMGNRAKNALSFVTIVTKLLYLCVSYGKDKV